MFRRLMICQPKLMFALLALTLMVRVFIPTGFMQEVNSDGAIRVSLCTGMGPQMVWLDKTGHIHKDKPEKHQQDLRPCGFGALAYGVEIPDMPPIAFRTSTQAEAAIPAAISVTTGHGLAAPPPPSTGPPLLS